MKSNFIHVCFVIDSSSSMYNSINDVKGGFKSIIEEQQNVKEGTCAVSMFTFNSGVQTVYIGKDVKDVSSYLEYRPEGYTAMNDGIGTAIDTIGKWLSNMPEDERPEKNLVVIMTDGEENSSYKYTFDKVREMIQHQEDKYNWTFMFIGVDLRNVDAAKDLGIKMRGVTTRLNVGDTYCMYNEALSTYRTTVGDVRLKSMAFMDSLNDSLETANAAYTAETGIVVD